MTRFQLPFRAPYAVSPLTGALGAHSVAGLERRGASSHTRVIRLPSGPAIVTVSWSAEYVTVDADVPESDCEALTATVRRWLDLDADHSVIDPALLADELMAPLVTARPGLRVLGSVDGFETAVLTVLGQQVSLGAARTFGARFVAAFGEPVAGKFFAFPTPHEILAHPPETIRAAVGLTQARARTVHAVAVAAADGLDLSWGADPAQCRRELLALRGIGPWTVDYLSVRVLGDRDAFVPDDLVLRRALGVSSGKEAAAASERWRPWRAYALFHLWTAEVFV